MNIDELIELANAKALAKDFKMQEKRKQSYEKVFSMWVDEINCGLTDGDIEINLSYFDKEYSPDNVTCCNLLKKHFNRPMTFTREKKYNEDEEYIEIEYICCVNIKDVDWVKSEIKRYEEVLVRHQKEIDELKKFL